MSNRVNNIQHLTDDKFMTAVRTLAMKSSHFSKVLLGVSREVGQGLFESIQVSFLHVAFHRRTVYTVLYTVLLERTNSVNQHSDI
jgi:hypothetical protein